DLLARPADAGEPRGDEAREMPGIELADDRQERRPVLVALAEDADCAALTALAGIEQLLHLRLEERALLLDHQDLLQPLGEGGEAARLERPDEARLVEPEAEAGGGGRVDAEELQRLQHVEISL